MENDLNDLVSIKPNVTAQWAREICDKISNTKAKQEFEKCLNSIQSAVLSRKKSVTVDMTAESLTIKTLSDRGFKVKQMDDPRDGNFLEIKW